MEVPLPDTTPMPQESLRAQLVISCMEAPGRRSSRRHRRGSLLNWWILRVSNSFELSHQRLCARSFSAIKLLLRRENTSKRFGQVGPSPTTLDLAPSCRMCCNRVSSKAKGPFATALDGSPAPTFAISLLLERRLALAASRRSFVLEQPGHRLVETILLSNQDG
jgi:hypothetical protein